jgi:hypothetical protein
MTYSLVVSFLMAVIGVVLWVEGGPHPRTWAAWLLLVVIVIVSEGVSGTGGSGHAMRLPLR